MSECFPRACWCCLFLICFAAAAVAVAQETQTQNPPPASSPQPPRTQPQDQPAQSQSTQGQQTPDQQSQEPPSDTEGGGFVFKKEVEEVVLHAIVVDQNNHLVSNLSRDSFSIFEDGKPQKITSFRHEDVPVALGILVDNSGSMLPKRVKLSEAAVKLVEASQGEDRVFVVNFGENPYLDQDFTSDVAKLNCSRTHRHSRQYRSL